MTFDHDLRGNGSHESQLAEMRTLTNLCAQANEARRSTLILRTSADAPSPASQTPRRLLAMR